MRQTEAIAVTEGVHQGSVVSPYLFCLVIVALTERAQTLTPWNCIYADDIAICITSREEFGETLDGWKLRLEIGDLILNVVCTKPDSHENHSCWTTSQYMGRYLCPQDARTYYYLRE